MIAATTRKTVFYILLCNFIAILGRSPLRPQDPIMPEIITCWPGSSATHHLRDHCLEEHALFFKFDRDYFMDHLLPDEPIPFRLDHKKEVLGSQLKAQIEELLTELNNKKKKFKYFKVLKDSDFNTRSVSGLIILKFKEYPFVLKLFIKTPETFAKPHSEGIIPRFFFRMGGGINRHLSGFTRVKNLEDINKRIDQSPHWRELIDTPRKWFWLPKNPQWIEVRGKNIGRCDRTIELPAIYGIIADFIENAKSFSIMNRDDRRISLDFANYCENRVDAHADNFMVEKSTGIIVLIDTEHFPTMVGLKEAFKYDNYPTWYMKLSAKCFRDIFLRTKKQRRELQLNPTREMHPCYPNGSSRTVLADSIV